MRKTVERYFCDICKKEADITTINYPVVFHTEQTEGRSCKPYISQEKIDLCFDCLKKSLTIHGLGCQGFNEYEIRLDGNWNG